MSAESNPPFIAGVNYPWIAYGHDFGKNEWGHDGLITGGWTYQTYADSQGFTDTRFSKSNAHAGTGSLRLTADLIGGHPNRSKGEVYIDLRNHTPAGISVPLDVRNFKVSCWLFLPSGSAGESNHPNGVQFFFKSGDAFKPFYTAYQDIRSDQEGRWVLFTADASGVPAYEDDLYDPTKVIAVGVKIGTGGGSNATLAGTIFLDDYVLDAAPAISFDFESLEVERDFAALQQVLGKCSTPAIRVFVFGDGRAAPEFIGGDYAVGFDEYFFLDFDALLEAARQNNLKVIPVLLDYQWFYRLDSEAFNNGVQLGGRSSVIRNADRMQAFLQNALQPLVERYCDNAQILAWEVINEPEWATKDFSAGFPRMDPVTMAEMQEFVRRCAATIHSCAGQKVTVGSARRMWMHYWRGLGLDLLQFHWYEHFAEEEPFPWQPYSQLAFDEPVLVGEVPTISRYSASDYLLGAADGGYHGLLSWSYRLRNEVSDFTNARPALERRCAPPRRHAVRPLTGAN